MHGTRARVKKTATFDKYILLLMTMTMTTTIHNWVIPIANARKKFFLQFWWVMNTHEYVANTICNVHSKFCMQIFRWKDYQTECIITKNWMQTNTKNYSQIQNNIITVWRSFHMQMELNYCLTLCFFFTSTLQRI